MPRDLLTHYGKVRIPSIKSNEPMAGGLSHYRINTRYINNTKKIIRVKLRSGLDLIVPAAPIRSPQSRQGEFIVEQELVVSPSCTTAMNNYFSGLSDDVAETTEVLEVFRETYLKVYATVYEFNSPRDVKCVIEHVFTDKELAATDGIFYHDELDCLFKFGEDPFDIPHPHTPAGRQLTSEEAGKVLHDQHGFVFWVEIIDNLGKYGDRYLPICNKIFKIPARTDKNRPDGLYIVSSKPTNGKINPNEVTSSFSPLEEAEKELGFYRSHEEALAHGDMAGLRKRELAELEHTRAIEREQFQLSKQRFEAELEEKNRRLRELEADRAVQTRAMEELSERQEHLLKMQKMQMEDFYSRRSAERKDASEFIKFLPTILAAAGTLLLAWKTFRVPTPT